MANYGRRPAASFSKPAPKIRGKVADQDAEPYAIKYACATHQVTYYVPANSRESCPVCMLNDQHDYLVEENAKLRNQVERLTAERDRLRIEVDVASAMKDAVDILGQDDFLWLKTMLYRYKIDKTVAFKVSHDKKKKPVGFMAIFKVRGEEPVAYNCTSIGGFAMAEYYEEALNVNGTQFAMGLLMRAFWKHLPGATT